MSKKMYNEEFKQAFIETLPSELLKTKTRTVFYATYAMEMKKDKDVFDFNKQELITLFESCNWTNKNYFNISRGSIIKYKLFAVQSGKINEASMSDIISLKYTDINNAASYLNKYYKTFDELTNALNTVFESETDFILLRIKCVCGLLWYEIPEEDIMELSLEQVDSVHNTIQCSNEKNKIAVSKNIIDWCNTLGNTFAFVDELGRSCFLSSNKKIIKTKTLQTENRILDRSSHDSLKMFINISIRTIEKRLAKMTEEQRNSVNYKGVTIKTIEKNGRFVKAYEKEKESTPFVNSGNYRDALGTDRHRSIDNREFEEYCSWKKAFDL